MTNSNFLYFIPTAKGAIERRDLPPRLQQIWRDADGWQNRGVRGGPGNADGVIVSMGDRIGYHPDQQQWHRSTCGAYHIGWWSDGLPGEAQLRRTRPLDGGQVRMGNGQDWTIPILHGPGLTIPRAWGWGPNGPIELKTIGGYEELLAQSETYLRVTTGEQRFPSFDDWFAFVVKLLNVNYRVDAEELAALGAVLVDRAFIRDVLRICLGYVAFEAEALAQKKTHTLPDGCEGTPAAPA